jgi:6-phospho-beta-glucosidase
VETVCEVRPNGLQTVPAGDVPEDCLLLMQAVKRYERLTVEAIRERSRDLAVEALMVHPLVGSYPVAKAMVDAYLTAHAEHVGDWR